MLKFWNKLFSLSPSLSSLCGRDLIKKNFHKVLRDPWLQVLSARRECLLFQTHLIAGSTLAGAAQDFLASPGVCYPADPIRYPSPEHCEIAPISLPWPVSGAGHCLCPRTKGAERKGPRELTGHLRNCSGRDARITKENGILLSCSIFFSCSGCSLVPEPPGSQNVLLSQRAKRSRGRRFLKGKCREQHIPPTLHSLHWNQCPKLTLSSPAFLPTMQTQG